LETTNGKEGRRRKKKLENAFANTGAPRGEGYQKGKVELEVVLGRIRNRPHKKSRKRGPSGGRTDGVFQKGPCKVPPQAANKGGYERESGKGGRSTETPSGKS